MWVLFLVPAEIVTAEAGCRFFLLNAALPIQGGLEVALAHFIPLCHPDILPLESSAEPPPAAPPDQAGSEQYEDDYPNPPKGGCRVELEEMDVCLAVGEAVSNLCIGVKDHY
jgi:hypothetical protein